MSEVSDRQRDIEAGRDRIDNIIRSFDDEWLKAIEQTAYAEKIRTQPWLVAGVSDGMGLHVTLAALESGLLRQGVGVYYEPPTLLEKDDDGEPVSPVHWARYQNALALEEYAEELGVDFTVLSEDMILAPQRGLKGDLKGEPSSVPEPVCEAFESARSTAACEDAVFIDSVAFGKWICPREGEDPVEVPNVDFQGRIVHSETKQYHPRGYQETLDTMGRNHGALLERFEEFGWFGPDTVTTFFTWAGGSQHVGVLEGIYGRGALGDAKIIAERDVAEFRMEHGTELGAHGIVRFPAFLSAALMAIPGGGLFGLVSRRLLESEGLHMDIPELAARMLRRLFGREWVRDNPIAQIELDSAERLLLPEISRRVEKAHERIEEYRRSQPEEERREPIPLEESRQLLRGLVPSNYPTILSRFRPDEEELDSSSVAFEYGGYDRETRLPPHTRTLAEGRSALRQLTRRSEPGAELTSFEDDVRFEVDRETWEPPLQGLWRIVDTDEEGKDAGRAVYRRELRDDSGATVLLGETTATFGGEAQGREDDTEQHSSLGTPVGYRRTIDAPMLREFVGKAHEADSLAYGLALAGFAESALHEAGLLERLGGRLRWSFQLYRPPSPGDQVLTYVRPEARSIDASVVDGEGDTLLALRAEPAERD